MFLVISIQNNVLDKVHHIGTDKEKSEVALTSVCKERIPNWDEYTKEEVDEVLDQGYERHGSGSVALIDTDSWTSAQDILKQIDQKIKQPV